MIPLKNLLSERARLITSVVGVGFAVMLVLVMTGIFVGTTNQVTTYIDHHHEEVWVAQPGTTQMFRSVSWLPDETRDELLKIPGVAGASPVLGVPTSFVRDGSQTAIYLLGYDPKAAAGGPWKLAEGRAEVAAGETVLDRVLAAKNGVGVGDTVELADASFTVVGLSEETAAVGNFYAFISLEDAKERLRADNRVSYFLVQPEPGADPGDLAAAIDERLPGAVALTSGEFSDNSREIVISMMGRPFYAMIAIGVLVGVALVSLTVLASAAEQMREFGVLKAIGVATPQVYGIVLTQAALLAVSGYALGASVTYGLQFLLAERMGDVTIEITAPVLLAMFAVTLVMAALGSIGPVRRVTRLDPAIAFRN
ncbi:ABC transporter permease [Streptomyces sodiiphilus]|uniref:ABC transporter permease n=1 Tax=Streptomyces sodiiphilus TaxID=226217 RepID=A0ABN2PUL2_9ACTN